MLTLEEIASDLYDLVVIRGRWGGVNKSLFGNGSYESLPDWMQEVWLDEAKKFAANYDLKTKE